MAALLGGREDLAREGLVNTPRRLAKAMQELTSGYEVDPRSLLVTFESEGDAMVAVKDIPFASLCEHHVLPFTGTVSVAYIPSGKIVGLSKIPRIVRAITRRLQVQERIAAQVAWTLQEGLCPVGLGVIVRAVHSCMCLRGVESTGEMVTTVFFGSMREDAAARAEALKVLGR
jgi:GTP cyclohydrolase I